jgi:hypothetical protein
VAGDNAPVPELLDCAGAGWDGPEPDIVNGSVPLLKNPADCVEDDDEEDDDEACEARDLTASHAADAAVKAINMIKIPNLPRDRGQPFHC